MTDEDELPPAGPPPSAADRTVFASPDMIAAAEAEAAARAASAAPQAPPPAPQAELDAPPAQAAEPAVAGFGHGAPGQLVGTVLNDLFEIVRFIARGGMGEVYEGRNIASHERVAIKVILPQFASDEQFMSLFRREASSLERLGHDALVKYRTLAFDRTTRLNYLAIEYVDGPPMSDILDGVPADPATVRVVLRRLAAGLATAHEAGVVHRDLSPDNILLPEGQVVRAKIIDFGIAKDTNPGEKSVVGDAFAGKFGYAAPEIFGKYGRQVGPWTDVYSLALTVLAYANGRPLDMGITIVDALEARDKVPDLSFLAPGLIPVFTHMLAPDPAQRFRSMEDVVAALDEPIATLGEQLRTSFEVAPQPAEPVPSALPPAGDTPAFVRGDYGTTTTGRTDPQPRSKLPLIGGAGALLVALAAGGWFAFGGSGGHQAPTTTAASTTTAAVPAGAPAEGAGGAPRADWSTARAQAATALAAVGCSDMRIAADPGADGAVRLTGWRPSGSAAPVAPAGYSFDTSGVAQVPQPSGETCGIIESLRRAIPATGAAQDFAVRTDQSVSMASAPKAAGGSVAVDLGATATPAGKAKTLIVNVDNQPGSGEERLVSAPAASFDLTALPFDRKAKRYLAILIAGRSTPPTIAWPLDPSRLAAACAGDACSLASGWIDITP